MDTPLNELLDQWAEKKAEKTGRPKNKPSTMKQYEGHILKLQKAFDTTGYGFIEKPEDIVKLVKGKASTTQRNVFTAVYILTSYRPIPQPFARTIPTLLCSVGTSWFLLKTVWFFCKHEDGWVIIAPPLFRLFLNFWC